MSEAAKARAGRLGEALAAAFEEIGGVARLAAWAEANETEFYKMWARLVPGESAGATGPLTVEIVRLAGEPDDPAA